MVDVDARASQERHACPGEQDPKEVLDATRPDRRHEERAQELRGDGDPERYSIDGRVEERVHDGQDRAKREHGRERPTPQTPQGAPAEGDQDRRSKGLPEPDGP